MNNAVIACGNHMPALRKNILPLQQETNLSDFILFPSVMKNKEAYECVLSIILDDPDLKLKEVHVEEMIPNKSGKRSVRLDVRGIDLCGRRIGAEMQNDIEHDDLRKRIRFYQAIADAPYLKSGKGTKYRDLPATCIIMITQEDLFGRDRAKYVFEEWCQGDPGLPLDDGTMKIFLNMESRNGRPELVSLLQYMKDTRLDNPEIIVKDDRIVKLDKIVAEVKQSEEWEDLKMSLYTSIYSSVYSSIYTSAMAQGEEIGRKQGETIGMRKGEQTGLRAMVHTLKGFLPDDESVWKAVTENDAYKDVTLGEIKKLY